MPKEFSRSTQVNVHLRKLLAEPVRALAKKEKLGLVSLQRVVASPDLRQAKVYLSVYPADQLETALVCLQAHVSDLSEALKVQWSARRMPVLHFFADDEFYRQQRIQDLLSGEEGEDG